MRDRFCIILLNQNEKKETLECLDSIYKLDYSLFAAIVIDRGSNDGSVASIREAFPRTPIFEEREDIGIAEANNVGIQWIMRKPFKWIFLLNNRSVVAPNCLRAFLATTKKYSEAKIFGAKIYRGDRIDHLGGSWNSEKAIIQSLGCGRIDDGVSFEESTPVDYISGTALLMHRSVPETIGFLEPTFKQYWIDADYCFRARRKGFEVRTAPQVHCWHRDFPQNRAFWWRDRLLWLTRNLLPPERKQVMKSVIWPELLRLTRNIGNRRCRESLAGVVRYFLKI
jgi:hypothetical protein